MIQTRYIICGAVLAALVVGIAMQSGRKNAPAASPEVIAAVHPVANSVSEPRRSSPGPSAANGPFSDPTWVSNTKFQSHFGISDQELAEIDRDLMTIRRDLNEQKGLAAQIVNRDGNRVQMVVPALVVSEADLQGLLTAGLRSSSAATVGKIWSDSLGRRFVSSRLGLDELGADVSYDFLKVREENRSLTGSQSRAAFDVEIHRGNAGANIEIVRGMTLGEATETRFLGWNAVSKLPRGYITSAEIKGVESRPRSAVNVVVDDGTGVAEIRNLRSEGSRETVLPDATH